MSEYAAPMRPADCALERGSARRSPNGACGVDVAQDAHGPAWCGGAPAAGRNAAGRMPYFDTPQKCGQISVVASIPESFGEAMLYV